MTHERTMAVDRLVHIIERRNQDPHGPFLVEDQEVGSGARMAYVYGAAALGGLIAMGEAIRNRSKE